MAQVASPGGGRAGLSIEGVAFGMALVVFAGTLWSLQGLLVRLMDSSNPWPILLVRGVVLAVATVLILFILGNGRAWPLVRGAGWRGLAAGLALGASGSFFVVALSYTTIANAVFILGAGPFFAAFLSRWILGESVRRQTWIAMGFSLLGVFLMVFDGLEGGGIMGSMLVLFSSLTFAIYSVILKTVPGVDMNPAALHKGWTEAAIAASVLLVASWWPDQSAAASPVAMSAKDILLSLGMGLLLASGMLVFTIGARRLSPAEMTLGSLTELVLSPVWVWIFVHEVPDALTLVGGAIIIGAIIYQAASGARRPRPPVVV
ncbi:DMT family transporter [Rhodoligotrophos defluvii]|uniref:DMT family transporter n=1 Tax=Rhodoligotrophos defluvii TaxID=2561934 RepID=UPI0010C9919C|nr:DMT family transporter [Rhodoligotrophos defluvii]